MQASYLAILGLAACRVAASTDGPAVPRLHGLTDLAVSDRGSADATRALGDWDAGDPSCAAGAFSTIDLDADVAPAPGIESVFASYAQGILVVDRDGQPAASLPGYPCSGSADELDLLAAGSAYGDRTLVVMGTSGGHRERTTWVNLFRVGTEPTRLDPVFAGTIEERGASVRYGSISLLPGALVHRTPAGPAVFYVFDPVARAYVVPGERIDPDRDGPAPGNAVSAR
jgi:hypothetical protein